MKPKKPNPVRIGVFVVGGLVIVTAAVLFVGSGRFFRRTHPFVSYFDGSVNGLRTGAAVKFKGVEVGMVDRIRIPGGLMRTDQPIAVFYSVDGDELAEGGDGGGAWADVLSEAIQNGLRAQLESDSLVTGVQHVSLVFEPESTLTLHEPIDGALEIPTIPPPLQEIGMALRSIVDRIGRYDFEGLLDGLRQALGGIADLSKSPELRSAIASLDAALQETRTAVARIGEHVDPVAGRLVAVADRADAVGADLQEALAAVRGAAEELRSAADAMETTITATGMLLDPEAPIAVELRTGLRELSETARATRALFELLERDPAALVRGKGEPERR